MSGRPGPPEIKGMYSLKVDNLTFRTTIGELKRTFSRYGDIGDIYIPRDPRSFESRGFAFVRYYDRRDADDAIDSMDGAKFDGRRIRVQFARYDRPNSRRDRSYSRSRSRDRSRSRERRRSRSRDRERRSRSRDRHRSTSRDRHRSSSRDRRRSSSRDRHRSASRDRHRSASRDHHRSSSRDHHRSGSREHYRSASKEQYRSASRDRYRSASHESAVGNGDGEASHSGEE